MDKRAQISGRMRYGAGGAMYRIVTSKAESKGTLFVIEATEPPGGGPPLHIHRNEVEYFFVLEGEITFTIDGKVTKAGPGGSAFIPRGAPHCFRNCTDRQARVIILFTPGDIEGFFDYGLPLEDGTCPTEKQLIDELVRLAGPFGLEVVGPSPL